ncbi:MAG TPA: aminoacyl--tRNA ligase-related protein, partial [Candidatus Nitrosocosmicus sp.]|nr:aminoacyl--tRNA ligase-related protein [Candidatus Nitrosocosmicus sp.]
MEKENREIEEKYRKIIYNIPNFFHDSVPIGKDESANKIIRVFDKNLSSDNVDTKYGHVATSGKEDNNDKTSANTQIKNHIKLSHELDLLDLERAGKIAGARFYFLKNDLVKLGLALTNFAIDYLIEREYVIIQPPYMIKKEAMEGAVILNDFEETIYKIENEDLYMIGTSEHPLASMHMNEILEGKGLPLRYAGISPCFRKEAGAHGKDMKGIF